MPREIVEALKGRRVVEETPDLLKAVREADVVYMTRIQRERFADPTEYERLKDSYILTQEALREGKGRVTVMHPLPRVNEIETSVDQDSGAAYFRQAANGIPVRMALLALVTGAI